MANQTETIRKFVSYLNNPDEQGGFWLPNIQRPFVWKEEQIERLYDSILREYPIGTLLVWKTKSRIKRRKFIDNFHENMRNRLKDFFVPEDDAVKMLVLDGQQRMQSLFIGLKGSYNRKELYLNVLSGDIKAPEDIKYEFKFSNPEKTVFPWIKFKSLVFSDKRTREIKDDILSNAGDYHFGQSQLNRMEDNIEIVREVFCTQENILYQLVDSVDRPKVYLEEDIVEIFIRANSGGTPLGKSDLLFSLLTTTWEEADENLSELLEELNRTGYNFTRDFILKTCLVLLDKGARYKVEKFRDESIRSKIVEDWDKIADSIATIKDFVYGNTFLRTDKTIPSYLSLIPLIYVHYHYPSAWEKYKTEYKNYLVRTSLTGVFGGSPDNLLDKLIRKIKEIRGFELAEIYGVIREDGRSLEISQELILNLNYWRKEIHLLFNLWYSFNYQPAVKDNAPQIDHIFPQSALKAIKTVNPETGKKNIMKYPWQMRDQIGNLMLLTAAENGAGGKTDKLPTEWFADKSEEYLDLHLIPRDRELWKLENFERFVEERMKLILDKFEYLIVKKDLIAESQ